MAKTTAKAEKERPPLWHVRCVSPGGGIDSYIKVRAKDVSAAALRAQRKTNLRYEDQGFFPEDWFVTYICLVD